MSRDFRRAAVFRWRMPLEAALSMTFTAARSAAGSRLVRAFLTSVLILDFTDRLRSVRFAAWRNRFCPERLRFAT